MPHQVGLTENQDSARPQRQVRQGARAAGPQAPAGSGAEAVGSHGPASGDAGQTAPGQDTEELTDRLHK